MMIGSQVTENVSKLIAPIELFCSSHQDILTLPEVCDDYPWLRKRLDKKPE